jgi:predicted GNAT family N-acyltransferase
MFDRHPDCGSAPFAPGGSELKPPSSTGLLGGITFQVAAGSDRSRVLEFRRRVYATDWPNVPVDEVIDKLDASAHQLMAIDASGEVIAAFRIVPPESRPFDLEYYISLSPILGSDRAPAEIGRLCVAHDNRQVRSNPFMHIGLLKLAYDFSARLQLTDLVLTALPKLRAFYRVGFFREIGVTFTHNTWGKVHVMHLDLVSLPNYCRQTEGPVARLLLAEALPNFQI